MSYLLNDIQPESTQREPIPGTNQTRNNAGGYAWAVDDWTRLDRFLILGTEGGTYYQRQQALTLENANAVLRCLQANPAKTLHRIVEVSEKGLALKNDPALFALALATTDHVSIGTRQATLWDALPRVARTGTHILHFVAFVTAMRGWGRSLRSGVGNWFAAKDARSLAYQAVKYQSRDAWALRDLLRLAHPKVPDGTSYLPRRAVYDWILHGWPAEDMLVEPGWPDLLPIHAFERLKRATSESEVVRLIELFDAPREAVPTQWLNSPDVWEALLQKMPIEATLRNLAKMSRVGLLTDRSEASQLVAERLNDQTAITRSRLHPIKLLIAHLTYAQGHGEKSDATWAPAASIVDATQDAFYLAFGNVPATGKPTLLCLDISASMEMSKIAGMPFLSARMASAALALVTAAVEPHVGMCAFSTELRQVHISSGMRLHEAVNAVSRFPHGGTNCSLPILAAIEHKAPVHTFVIYTDSETWAGNVHPSRALKQYRELMGIDAKLIVVGMTASEFSIADPDDKGMLDVVGFDPSVPALMSWFVGGDELIALPQMSQAAEAGVEVPDVSEDTL